MIRVLVALALLALLGAGTGSAQAPSSDLRPTVILVSFDGWRWDYTQKYPAPNLQRLVNRGVSAALIPSFPSKTFPNHYTIVTGLYPGHHGVIANAIKDPPTGRRLTMSDRVEVQDPMWWGGEPLWVTVQRAGQAAAAMFWPGSEAPILGQRPRYWVPFDDKVPGARRVDRVLGWLDLPVASRPTFLTLYFSEVDGAGHDKGPDSTDVRAAVRRVDGHLGRLLRGLERRRIEDRVNIVVVSDHGMAEATDDRIVVLDDLVALDGVDVIDLNPTLGLFPPPAREEAVYATLAGAHPRLKVYRRAETPAHWHYREHPRIPPIVGVMDEGWQILRRSTVAGRRSRGLRGPTGVHGYDPATATSMRGIFVAAGPAFKVGTTVAPLENIHLYNALSAVLGVTPAANDGDPAVGRSLLR
jgi:predicted AlkP superfamily pyrophosphatase or phosphodiesterase